MSRYWNFLLRNNKKAAYSNHMNDLTFLEMVVQLLVNRWTLSTNKPVKKYFSEKSLPFYCLLEKRAFCEYVLSVFCSMHTFRSNI